MTPFPGWTFLTFTAVPPLWFVLLVLGVLFGAPIAGLVHGARMDAPAGKEYVLAGGVSLGFVAFLLVSVTYLSALLGERFVGLVLVATLVVPGWHLATCRERPNVNTLVLAACYAPFLFALVLGLPFGIDF